MSQLLIQGTAHAYGDDIDTDRIIAGKYTKTLVQADLAAKVLEDLDPEFRTRMKPGDVLVGGHNFGCGSSREQAPLALKAAGVGAVVASSFARIFFRNAINTGLPVIDIGPHSIAMGDELKVDMAQGVVVNLTQNVTYEAKPMPEVMQAILTSGGLVPYMREHGGYRVDEAPSSAS